RARATAGGADALPCRPGWRARRARPPALRTRSASLRAPRARRPAADRRGAGRAPPVAPGLPRDRRPGCRAQAGARDATALGGRAPRLPLPARLLERSARRERVAPPRSVPRARAHPPGEPLRARGGVAGRRPRADAADARDGSRPGARRRRARARSRAVARAGAEHRARYRAPPPPARSIRRIGGEGTRRP